MRKSLFLLVLGIAMAQPASAQIDIQGHGGTVTFGKDGINIRQAGQSVKMDRTGVSIDQPGQRVNIKSTGKSRATTTRVKTTVKSGAPSAVKTSATVSTSASSKLTLDQRLTKLEMLAYGKKSEGTLIARVQKLEVETLGAAGTGSIDVRLTKLASALGSGSSEQRTVVKETVVVAPGQPSISAHTNVSGVANDIVIDNSGHNGTIACNGNNVVLNASGCSIKFTGSINSLVINGSSNDLTCDTVRHVQANGSANDVSWNRSFNPTIGDAGSANTLKAR